MTDNALEVLPPLPGPGATDQQIAEWIETAVEQLDNTPPRKYWRWHVLDGRGMANVIAESAPRHYRLDIWVPVTEQRLLKDAAEARGIGVRTYMRSAVATILCACDGYSSSEIPELAKHGLILPRR